MAANVLLLFAPLLFLFEASSYVDPTAPGSGLLFLLADPAHLVSVSDLVMVIGVLVLCGAVLLVLVGLLRGDRRVSVDAAIAGVVCFACLVAWAPTMLLAGGTGRGRVEGVEAVAASGGWSIASLVLLVAALAYLAFALRADRGARPVRVASYWWPVYAAVNVVGAAAIAGFFGGDASDLNALSIGLILRLTLVPVLGVVAYSDLHDRIQRWAYLPVVQPPQVRRPRVVRPSPRPRVVEPSPPPPPPEE